MTFDSMPSDDFDVNMIDFMSPTDSATVIASSHGHDECDTEMR